MKKILLAISIFFLSLLTVKASDIPVNIYYVNDGLYAYLEPHELNLDENEKLYIEYRINEEVLDLIEIKTTQNTIFLSDEIDDIDNTLISSRFAIYDEDYTYLDWSEEEKITKFDFIDKPKLVISSLKYDKDFTYEIVNRKEIEDYFQTYKKIYNLDLEYKEEYEVDDSWSDTKPLDLSDIKLNFRVYYEIGNIKSDYSNVLKYEIHPKTCMFDSTFCCNQILNISICIWILFLSILLILILVFIDHRHRLKKEA